MSHSQVLYVTHQPRTIFFIQLFDLELKLRVLLLDFLHLVLVTQQGLGQSYTDVVSNFPAFT